MVCSSVGVMGLIPLLAPVRRRLAAAVLALLATLHLFIGLSHFTPGSPKNLLEQAQFETQVGPLWTGAYLYKTYFTPWFLGRSLRQPGFGRENRTQQTLDSSLAEVEWVPSVVRQLSSCSAGGTGTSSTTTRKYMERTTYVGAPGPEWTTFATETWMTLGGARLMSIRWANSRISCYAAPASRPGRPSMGLAFNSEIDNLVRHQVPQDLVLVVPGDTKPPVRRYRLVRAAP